MMRKEIRETKQEKRGMKDREDVARELEKKRGEEEEK